MVKITTKKNPEVLKDENKTILPNGQSSKVKIIIAK